MAHDAMMITVDKIRFTYLRKKKMRVYAVGIAADNRGKVLVTEPPGSAAIRHNPKAGRPAVWDFGGDGYPIYHRTGELAEIIALHLLIVRDRRATREAGEIVKEIGGNDAAKASIKETSKALVSLGKSGIAAASALGLVLPLATLVGKIIGDKQDKVLQTLSGSLFVDEERKQADELSQTIIAPDNNMELDADVFFFDGAIEEDSVADTRDAEIRLVDQGLLFSHGD